MQSLHHTPHGLHLEEVSLTELADSCGTPAYVYSQTDIERQWHTLDRAFGDVPHRICYAVKASSNLALLNLIARLGSGFEIVSGGELHRVIQAGGDPKKVMFAGVGKTIGEIEHALSAEVYCLNAESFAELKAIEAIAARLHTVAPVALRVNPNVEVSTHAYITTGRDSDKFGVAYDEAAALYRYATCSASLQPLGVGCHIGSQITDLKPLTQAVRKIVLLARELVAENLPVKHINLGGGLGIAYQHTAPGGDEYVRSLLSAVGDARDCPWEIIIEPGRYVVGEAGLLLTRVTYIKSQADKHFAVVDAAMNDLLRPALYQAAHPIVAVNESVGDAREWDIVGPVCESGDFLARQCPLTLAQGDLLAVLAAGAYGFSMASHYNSRPKPPEILVRGANAKIIRKRETYDDLIAGESLPNSPA